MTLDPMNMDVDEAGDHVAAASSDNRGAGEIDARRLFHRRDTTTLDNERRANQNSIRQNDVAAGDYEHEGTTVAAPFRPRQANRRARAACAG